MKTLLIVACLVFAGGILLVFFTTRNISVSETVKRLESRGRAALEGRHPPTDAIMSNDWVKKERVKNLTKNFKKFIEVIKDIDRCTVTKTIDSNGCVITLINSKGEKGSLWITDGDKVCAITNY